MLGFARSPSNGVHNRLAEQTMVVHRQFHNRALLPVVIIFLVLSYGSVVLRLWTRAHFLKRLGWDDYIIIAAVVRVDSTVYELQKLTIGQIFFSIYCSTVLVMFILADDARAIIDIPPNHVEEVASVSKTASPQIMTTSSRLMFP
jgi:hypothetical protein